MADQKKQGKKLPKRASRPRHKAYRSACRAKQEDRKQRRRIKELKAQQANKERGITLWQIAKAERYARRHIN